MASIRTRDYELMMILSPEANEEEVSTMVDRVDGIISDGGGSVTDHETWGVRRLAYPILNFQEGNYVLTKFSANPTAIIELDRGLESAEGVLRHLVTKT